MKHTFSEGDRVSFYTNQGRDLAVGTIEGIYVDELGTDVANVDVEPDPFVLSGVHAVDLAALTPARNRKRTPGGVA